MSNVNPALVLTPDTYNNEGYGSITRLSDAYQLEPQWLSQKVTHLSYALGATYTGNNFPMLAMTEGAGHVKTIKGIEYKYPLIGKIKRTSMVAKSTYAATDKPGVGNSPFRVIFADRQFSDNQILYTPSEYQVQVKGDPIRVGEGYQYTLQIFGTGNPTSYLPVSDLQAGKIWGGGVHKVGFENSKAVESRNYLGGTANNMISVVRNDYQMRGDYTDQVMKYQIVADGKTFTTYADWEEFLSEMQFREACEEDLWWSTYGKGADGDLHNIDPDTGVPITSGAGIDQQITNVDTYGVNLTFDKLNSIIRDVFFNIVGPKPMIEMWTGTLGFEAFDRAMKSELGGFTQGVLVDSTTFQSGDNSWDLVYGAYFNGFRHVDGAMIKVIKHPMFDKGVKAEISDADPLTGLPLRSGDFYFLDVSTYEGERNIQYVTRENYEYKHWYTGGSFLPPGAPKTSVRSHDRDASAWHTMKSQGAQIMNPTACFKLKKSMN